ncbi:type II toxin-antitoxin system RelE/ParE family toxin [Pseudoduganella sp. OTU4001]|uniref:type II toxin-antitoxin system RelE/ParE family toxin n=1 Tax=Pseudoduganella sp. OTU4001 TaxID=3043854 RepID=UPI00313A9C74
MRLQWTSKALSDVVRLHDFLASVNKTAAARVVKSLVTAASGLMASPRIGERLEEFDPREIRRLIVGSYEVRYELAESTIYVLRIWHTRELR